MSRSVKPAADEPVTDEPVTDEEHTLRPLLLHSLSDIREVWLPLLEIADIRSVTEVGTESGVTTELLVRRLVAKGGGRLVVVDPDPGLAPTGTESLEVEVVRGFSPEALEGLRPTDAYLLDGDHNYWTVIRELEAIAAVAGDSPLPLVLMNDVSWPCARRDTYYDPSRLPPSGVHPHSFNLGVTLGKTEAMPGGFRGEGVFAVALHEGGPANGVLTAVEDFLAAHPGLTFRRVAPVFGLGVIMDPRASWFDEAEQHLAPHAGSRFLERLERNRVELYLRVIELQDKSGAEQKARQRDWARLDEERSALATRELEMLERVAAAERAVAAAAERARAADQRAAAAFAASATTPRWLPRRV